jgi:glycosyltransferase involved in cell wall biosynthesis
MNARPVATAVIPVHNGERFIAEAVASVLAQTYEPLECVVVDDGSADQTRGIVSSFGASVSYLRQPHRGSAAARNAGATAARGQFLAFLDADDIWKPTKIERQMEVLLGSPDLGLVYCSFELIDEEGRHLGVAPCPEPDDVLRNVLLNESASIGLGSTSVVRRQVFDAVGRFDERLSRGCDADLAWRLAAQYPIAAVREPLVGYRQHPAQLHRDVEPWERDWQLVLRTAFSSTLLPPEIQALERRARFNLAFTAAYLRRRDNRVGALARVLEAFWLCPLRTIRLLARSGARRLARVG